MSIIKINKTAYSNLFKSVFFVLLSGRGWGKKQFTLKLTVTQNGTDQA
jgi:hypothetical protein